MKTSTHGAPETLRPIDRIASHSEITTMPLDVAAMTFLDAIGPTGRLILLLLVGVPGMLLSVSLTSRSADPSTHVVERTTRLSKERVPTER